MNRERLKAIFALVAMALLVVAGVMAVLLLYS